MTQWCICLRAQEIGPLRLQAAGAGGWGGALGELVQPGCYLIPKLAQICPATMAQEHFDFVSLSFLSGVVCCILETLSPHLDPHFPGRSRRRQLMVEQQEEPGAAPDLNGLHLDSLVASPPGASGLSSECLFLFVLLLGLIFKAHIP